MSAALVVVLLAGCGGSGAKPSAPRETARHAVARYVNAINRFDGRQLCSMLAASARADIDDALKALTSDALPARCEDRANLVLHAGLHGKVDPAQLAVTRTAGRTWRFRVPGELGPTEVATVRGRWAIVRFHYQPALFRDLAGTACANIGATVANLPLLPTSRRELIRYIRRYADRYGLASAAVDAVPAPRNLFAAQRELARRLEQPWIHMDATTALLRRGAPFVATLRGLSRRLRRDASRITELLRKLHIHCRASTSHRRRAALARFRSRANAICRSALEAFHSTKGSDALTRLANLQEQSRRRARRIARLSLPPGLRPTLESTLETVRQEERMLEEMRASAQAGDQAAVKAREGPLRRLGLRAANGWQRLGLRTCAKF